MGRPVIAAWDKLVDYCIAAMVHSPIEEFHLLFLDKRNALIADQVQQHGTVNHTALYPCEVMKRALELGPPAGAQPPLGQSNALGTRHRHDRLGQRSSRKT